LVAFLQESNDFLLRHEELLPPVSPTPNFAVLIPDFYRALPQMMAHLQIANTAFAGIPKAPEALHTGLPLALSFADILNNNKLGIEEFFGIGNTPHTILFVFQNTREIRATGGFIGSVGVATIQNGALKDFHFQDVYDLDKQLKMTIPPPEEFSAITNRLFLRDANYSLHFPTSAQRIKWFYEQESGVKVDTVITGDERFLEWALSVAGPVTVGENISITPENAIFTIMYLVEGKFLGKGFDGTSPKEFLGKLAPELAQKVLKNISVSDIARLLKLISQKHLLAWSSQTPVQSLFEDFHITGEAENSFLPRTTGAVKDFFAIAATNMGANKSDGYISQNIDHTNIIAGDGTLSSVLKIKRTHTWGETDNALFAQLFSEFGTSATVGNEDLEKILGKGDNAVFMRVFLPPKITITSASGIFSGTIKTTPFPTYTEVSFFFPKVSAGKSEEINISYTLPEKVFSKGLEFTAVSQPGMREQNLTASVLSEVGAPLVSANPVLFSGEFLEDKSFLVK